MFYPGERGILEHDLGKMVDPSGDQKVIGLISPHAGYVYSGGCAGKAYSRVRVPDDVIILGVNHSGFGHPFAVDGHEFWQTPLGNAPLAGTFRERIVKDSRIFAVDSVAGNQEHSLEVQVPFIQYLNPKARILPITVSSVDLPQLLAAGRELASLLNETKDVLMIASTDMSHYISAESARNKDQKAIDSILALDPEGLFNRVVDEHISMCGMAPTVIMLTAALEAGATRAEVIEYTNSGETSGDFNKVVGYLSLIVY
jgi:AmmeMemoRadiSam system protein B